MTIKPFVAASIILFAAKAGAQSFSTGFGDGPGDPVYNLTQGSPPIVADLAGQNEWQINDATEQISFMVTRAGSQAGALGAFISDLPGESTVTVYHDTDAIPFSVPVTFNADFTISSSTEEFSGQDTFGFSFSDGGAAPLFDISFEPNVTPGGPLVAGYSTLGGLTTTTEVGILFDGGYHISINFSPSGSNVNFEATLSSSGTPGSFAGVITGAGAASIGRLGVFETILGGGDNFISFDNVTLAAVPEPGSLMLLGLSAASLILHRRRK